MSQTAAKAIKSVLDEKAIGEMLSVSGEIFGAYKDVYDFIHTYYTNNSAVPTVEVVQDKFGGDIFDGTGDVTGAPRHYIEEARNEFVKDSIDQMLITVSKNMKKRSSDEILAGMNKKISSLSQYSSRVEDVDITDVDLALEVFSRQREEALAGDLRIPTGIPVMDEYLSGGLDPGTVTVLFGYSGKAKTWIAEKIAAHVYSVGKRVLYVSLEMSADHQRARIYAIAGNGRFALNDLQAGRVPDEEIRAFGKDTLETGGALFVTSTDHTGDITPSIIRSKIDRLKPDLVIVDYYQLMNDNGKTKEMTPRMLNLSREIKLLAMSSRIPIIGIAAVTDDEKKSRNGPPQISQIAWSRGIEYDTDYAAAIHYFENSEDLASGIVEVVARKSRNSALFDFMYKVDLSRGVFEPFYGDGGEEY